MRIPIVLLLGLFVLDVGSARACFGPPPFPGLWTALESSDVVVVGRVEAVAASPWNPGRRAVGQVGLVTTELLQVLPTDVAPRVFAVLPDFPSGDPRYWARLRVETTIKGSVPELLHFPFEASAWEGGFGLPGATAVVFLKHDGSDLAPADWGWSVAYPRSRDEVHDLVAVLETAQALQTEFFPLSSPLGRRWMVIAGSLPGSRPWLRQELPEPTDEELRSLSDALLRLPSANEEGTLWLLHQLRELPDAAVDQAVLELTTAWMNQRGYRPTFFHLAEERGAIPEDFSPPDPSHRGAGLWQRLVEDEALHRASLFDQILTLFE